MDQARIKSQTQRKKIRRWEKKKRILKITWSWKRPQRLPKKRRRLIVVRVKILGNVGRQPTA